VDLDFPFVDIAIETLTCDDAVQIGEFEVVEGLFGVDDYFGSDFGGVKKKYNEK